MNKVNRWRMPTAEEAAHLKVTLVECIAEIDRLRELMRQDDIEIARSQAKTRALLAEINAMRDAPEPMSITR